MKKLGWLLPVGLLFCGVMAAGAADTVSPLAFRIEASNADGTDYIEVPTSELVYNAGLQRYTWSPVLPLELWGSDPINPIAVLNSATLVYQFGTFKRIGLTFNVSAGDTDTVFALQTGTMGFDTINSALSAARATAAIGVSDTDLSGAARMEEYPAGTGDGIYETWYDASRFAGLISVSDFASGGSESASYPAVGFASLGVPVGSMTTTYSFSLTAMDQGTGTTNFIVTPEPAALGLLAAALLLIRRR